MKVTKYLSKYLKVASLKAARTVTISAVEEEPVGTDKQKKLVAYFDQLDQGLVLGSKEILEFMIEEFGDDSVDWVGVTLVMFVDPTVKYEGKRVGGIRFKLPEPEEGVDVVDPEEE